MHVVSLQGTQFELERRYSPVRPLGQGAFGTVILALDADGQGAAAAPAAAPAAGTAAGQNVAIKKIAQVFLDELDTRRLLRELRLLAACNHENVIALRQLGRPSAASQVLAIDAHGAPTYGPRAHFEEVFVVQEYMETDLHRIIHSKQPLSREHVRFFLYQLLRAIKYLHSANILHRDLKPSNLLVNSNCDLKVCDFGLARMLPPEREDAIDDQRAAAAAALARTQAAEASELRDHPDMSEYVVTRWYRAPEVMVSCNDYSKPIDVWAAGCIFAELLYRRALFPGTDYLDQIRRICQRMGTPTDEELSFTPRTNARAFVRDTHVPRRTPQEIFPDIDADARDLLMRMLEFDPRRRITVTDAISHPFMATLHREEDEPVASFTLDFSYESQELTIEELRQMVWEYALARLAADCAALTLAPPFPSLSQRGAHLPPRHPQVAACTPLKWSSRSLVTSGNSQTKNSVRARVRACKVKQSEAKPWVDQGHEKSIADTLDSGGGCCCCRGSRRSMYCAIEAGSPKPWPASSSLSSLTGSSSSPSKTARSASAGAALPEADRSRSRIAVTSSPPSSMLMSSSISDSDAAERLLLGGGSSSASMRAALTGWRGVGSFGAATGISEENVDVEPGDNAATGSCGPKYRSCALASSSSARVLSSPAESSRGSARKMSSSVSSSPSSSCAAWRAPVAGEGAAATRRADTATVGGAKRMGLRTDNVDPACEAGEKVAAALGVGKIVAGLGAAGDGEGGERRGIGDWEVEGDRSGRDVCASAATAWLRARDSRHAFDNAAALARFSVASSALPLAAAGGGVAARLRSFVNAVALTRLLEASVALSGGGGRWCGCGAAAGGHGGAADEAARGDALARRHGGGT